MEKFRWQEVDLMLVDPDINSRRTVQMVLHNNGFRGMRYGACMDDLKSEFNILPPDILICEAELPDGDFAAFVRGVRHNEIGTDPFVPIIAVTTSPTGDLVKAVVNSGTDDLLTRPISTAQMLERIVTLVSARKPFVVSSTYVGPDRRYGTSRHGTGGPWVKVPNPLRCKATGTKEDVNLDDAISQINMQKLDRHAAECATIVERVLPGIEAGEITPEIRRQLEHLRYVAQDTVRRMEGTEYAHVSELANSLMQVVETICADPENAPSKDVKLLEPLAAAIQSAFGSDTDTAAKAHEISATVSAATTE